MLPRDQTKIRQTPGRNWTGPLESGLKEYTRAREGTAQHKRPSTSTRQSVSAWEFVCHPGYNDADLQAGMTRLRESREIELRVLTLPAAREVLAQQGIELISYRDLAPNAGSR